MSIPVICIGHIGFYGSLDVNRLLKLDSMDADGKSTDEYLNEAEALQLVTHLIKVFHVPESTIEVIHFPADCNRADVLRAAADRMDAGEKFDGTY